MTLRLQSQEKFRFSNVGAACECFVDAVPLEQRRQVRRQEITANVRMLGRIQPTIIARSIRQC
jgi:hypothetical protein